MQNQLERAKLLTNLHVKGEPLILFNIWDAGSAKALEECGAKALATGSWSVAAAQGYSDGEKIPLDEVLANLKRIIATVELPVSLDFEGGYGQKPEQMREPITKVLAAGAVGINLEDQIIGGEGLYSIEAQAAKIKAVREAAEQTGIPLFINARTDIFLKIKPDEHNESHLEEAILRAKAYAEAGASGFFAPGLRKAAYIEKLCKMTQLPVNIITLPDTPSLKELANLGVARISYGPGSYRQMIAALKVAGSKALARE